MLDLETLSLRKDARIIQIAATTFDFLPDGAVAVASSEFNCRVRDERGHVDPKTVEFWLGQPDAAARVLATPALDLGEALTAFTKFYEWENEAGTIAGIWANGATYDLPILSTAYASHGRSAPWSYKVERCMRTMLAASGSDYNFLDLQGAVAHDALWDCRVQVARLRAAVRALANADVAGRCAF